MKMKTCQRPHPNRAATVRERLPGPLNVALIHVFNGALALLIIIDHLRQYRVEFSVNSA